MNCVVDGRNDLGEGTVWDAAAGVLWWIDITGHRLYSYDPIEGQVKEWELPEQPGSLAVRAGSGLLLALANGFARFGPSSGRVVPLGDPEPDRPHNRMNDGKTDRQGRFWVGSMRPGKPAARSGALYRYDPDGSWQRVLDGLGIPNGLAWSPAGDTMYLAESLDEVIYAFDFDPDAGEISGRRVFATTEQGIHPDGSTVDADGFLWNAQWGGWRVVRYAPDGEVDRIIDMPVPNPTCCAFGGEDLDILFVTSARRGVDDIARAPQSGGLFAVDVGVTGLADTPYAG